jgi:hypothetical protein
VGNHRHAKRHRRRNAGQAADPSPRSGEGCALSPIRPGCCQVGHRRHEEGEKSGLCSTRARLLIPNLHIVLRHAPGRLPCCSTSDFANLTVYSGRDRLEAQEEAQSAAQVGIDVDGLPRSVLVGTVETFPTLVRPAKAIIVVMRPGQGVHGVFGIATPGFRRQHRAALGGEAQTCQDGHRPAGRYHGLPSGSH